jgi:hypothetical protein
VEWDVVSVNYPQFHDPGIQYEPREKACGSLLAALFRQEDINGLAEFINGAIQVAPLSLHRMYIASMRQLIHTGHLRRRNASSNCGLCFTTHRAMVE